MRPVAWEAESLERQKYLPRIRAAAQAAGPGVTSGPRGAAGGVCGRGGHRLEPLARLSGSRSPGPSASGGRPGHPQEATAYRETESGLRQALVTWDMRTCELHGRREGCCLACEHAVLSCRAGQVQLCPTITRKARTSDGAHGAL